VSFGIDSLWSWVAEPSRKKNEGLLAATPAWRVVAPQVTPAIAQWLAQGKVEWQAKTFAPADLDGAVSRHRGTSWRPASTRPF